MQGFLYVGKSSSLIRSFTILFFVAPPAEKCLIYDSDSNYNVVKIEQYRSGAEGFYVASLYQKLIDRLNVNRYPRS